MRRVLALAALVATTAACQPIGGGLPAVVTIHCGGDKGTGWATDVVDSDGWHSYVITSYHLVGACVGDDSGTLDAEGIVRNRIGLVRVRAGSRDLLGHVWTWDSSDDLAAVVLRESLDTLADGAPPQVGDRVAIDTRDGTLTRADREALLTTVPLTWPERGAPVLDADGDVIGTVVVEDGALRAIALPLLCRSLLDCAGFPEASWPGWP